MPEFYTPILAEDADDLWLITGASGGGKEAFVRLLAETIPDCALVSLEAAASLIEEERRQDDSDYVEGGVDIGRTVRRYLAEIFPESGAGATLDGHPQAARWGITPILDRGIKYLSTGEIRRTLLCRALLSGSRTIILSDPFEGLDTNSRHILSRFLDENRNIRVILCMTAGNIPPAVTHVLEWSGGGVSFCGTRAEYEGILAAQEAAVREQRASGRARFIAQVRELAGDVQTALWGGETGPFAGGEGQPLVDMRNVNVGWGDKRVLVSFSWAVAAGEHWLIRGPNGAGKTTLLELITGDNPQAFCNDVRLFGKKRGSGETLWDIRRNLGIVSHRLHVEYRMVGSTPVDRVIISGFHDSIGLYEAPVDTETLAARRWLEIASLARLADEPFSALSYGEQRAVLILRGAVKCPPLLILDEPCHGLDEGSRRMVLDLLETIAGAGTSTLLHVTHDPAEALSAEKRELEFLPGQNPMYCVHHKERP
ncbi:MAG: ATP-binding cassette domain-containing protein [Spirochaetaceae bacterium]|jgi:molybdate transport system ATP-binding protein|nr:ATP-binding cassette domain-containing protein [Spirochaetaceae bacterium]